MKTMPYTMSAAAMTNGPERCSSIQSSSGMPTAAAGMHATTILPQSAQVALRSSGVFLNEKGFRRPK